MNEFKNKIVCGFAGIGKSYAAKRMPGVVDLESTPFKEDWDLYIDVATHMQKSGYTVLVSCHKELRNRLKERWIDYVVVVPMLSDKDVYLERYKQRGNDEGFIKMMDENWEKFINEILSDEPVPYVVVLNGGHFTP